MRNWSAKNGFQVFLLLSGRSNVYLISKGEVNVMVDTAKTSSYHRLQENFKTVVSTSQQIDLLVLTHTHFDHCQNAFNIQQQYNCKVLMSENEAEYAIKGYTPLPDGTIKLTKLISRVGNYIGKKRFAYHSFSPDVCMIEFYNYELGNFSISIISTAGHSKGSVSIIVDNE